MNLALPSFVLQGGRSGVAAYIFQLLRGLAEHVDDDWHVDAIVPLGDRDLITPQPPVVSCSTAAACTANPVLALAWHNLVLPNLARQRGYDLIHIPSYRRIPLVKNRPVVATVHDLATFHLTDKYDRLRMLFNHKVVPAMIRRADHVIAVSQFSCDDIVRLIGYPRERITVVHHGIDHDRFRPIDGDAARGYVAEHHGITDPFAVYVSRLEHPAKNHVALIRAFCDYKKTTDSPLKLVLAGADWNGADVIRDCIAHCPYPNEIRRLGFVPLEDLPYLYAACALMVYPSHFEGFGFPIIEALACGAPVICSNTSSMKEIAGHLVPTFSPASVDEIAAAMGTALGTERTEEQRREALSHARSFRWDTCIRRVIEVYERTVGGTP